MKIKRKVEMNLPQLIEWAWENDVIDKNLLADNNVTPLRISIGGEFIFDNDYIYSKHHTFTVEVEEVVDSDTVLDNIYTVNVEGGNELDLNYYTNEPPKPITHEMFNKLIKQRDQYKAENEKLKTELGYAYKNWKAALSMGNSIAEEKSKADMENLKLKEEIERLQNKLKD